MHENQVTAAQQPPPLQVLELRQVKQAYGTHGVLDGLSFVLRRGRIGCLLGPSGCGKTTALRCIAGFEGIDAGEIVLDGEVVSRAHWRLPPESRRVGMVFQDYALFPHLDIAANIAFGLRGTAADARRARVDELLEVTGLASLGGKYPHELSGGQQQRVALARTLAPRPELVLLDEPFSSLDVELRERLSLEVRQILTQQHATALLVTHDQQEAFAIADDIGVLHQGRVQQWDSPYNVYHRPVNRFVADFVGQGVLLSGRAGKDGTVVIELGVLRAGLHTPASEEITPAPAREGAALDVLLRPDDVVHDDDSPTRARILHKAFRGAEILYTLQLASGARVLSLVPSHHNHAIGEHIGVRLDAEHVIAFAR